MENYSEIYDFVRNKIGSKRLFHSECVAKRCEEMALKNNYNAEIARTVGIMHDVAKEMPNDEKISYCMKNGIIIDEIEMEYPGILHGRIGAHIAKTKFGFSDEMCSAIECHTTGKANMSILDKILFIADMTGEDRDYFKDREYMIELADKSLDECCLYILQYVINEQMNKKQKIHCNSILAFNSLLKNNC